MADRLKCTINVGGFKVWPAEAETLMHEHPEIAKACVVASKHSCKGEAVKAIVAPSYVYKLPSP